MNAITELTRVINKNLGGCDAEQVNCLRDCLHSAGKSSDAFLYAALYMPELVLIEDSVLLIWGLPDEKSRTGFKAALSERRISQKELEASFNFVEIGYLFDSPGRVSSDEEDELLAKLVRDSWAGWLKLNYPERCFVVEVLAAETTGSTVGVHFFEDR